MTSRIGQPDTPADARLRECLDSMRPTSFVMIAGAGSGKTTSLVKALDYIGKKYGADLKLKNQKVVCITYTEIAEQEIWNDVGQNPLYHVSTIHSFLWTVIRSFQSDIKIWVEGRINEKIIEAEERIAKTGTRAVTKDKLRLEIDRHRETLAGLSSVSRFTYGTGSRYERGILGHDDIIKMVPTLIIGHPLLRSIIIEKYPYIFIDESQDTASVVVEAMKAVEVQGRGRFCLGFFGDPMQKIYTNGIGGISLETGWIQIEKPENFRCPPEVLSVINNIRAGGDSLVQVSGREGLVGSARIFILPADGQRKERLGQVRSWLVERNGDPLWGSDAKESDIRILVTLHRMAASRLGFADLYVAFNDTDAPSSLKDGFIDGSSWAIAPFLSYILPLLKLVQGGHAFEVVSFLRKNSPVLSKENLKQAKVSEVLSTLNIAVARFAKLFNPEGDFTVIDVLRHVRDQNILIFEERFSQYLLAFDAGMLETGEGLPEEVMAASSAMVAFFNCPAIQLLSYETYIEHESPFATQQGIKGAEFSRVLTVIDDEEGAHMMFSYNKYFGITAPSATDQANKVEDRETVIERTRRLFYVTSSRATKDLAVVFFTIDPETARQQILASAIFPEADIHVLADLV